MKRILVFWASAFFLLILLAPSTIPAATAPQLPDTGDATVEDMEELVRLLEDEQRREAFIRDLRTLIELKKNSAETEEGGSSEIVAPLVHGIERFSETTVREAQKLAGLVSMIPDLFGRVYRFLADSQNRYDLYLALARLLAGIVVALGLFLFIRRRLPPPPQTRPSRLGMVGYFVSRLFWGIAPWVALFLAVMGLYASWPGLPGAQDFMLRILWVLLLYKASFHAVRVLLAPFNPHLRCLGLGDEVALFLYRWFLRIGRYSVFYFIIRNGLLPLVWDQTLYSLIRGGTLVIFPVLLSVFIVKLATILRARPVPAEEAAGEEEAALPARFFTRAAGLAARYWPGPALLYVWIIFLFAIGRYTTGYEYLFWATMGTVGALIAAWGLMALLVGGFRFLIPIDGPMEQKALAAFRGLARVAVGLFLIIAVAWAWGLPLTSIMADRVGFAVTTRLLAIILTLGLMALAWEASRFAAHRLLEEKEGEELGQKMKTLTPIIITVIKAAVLFVGAIVILDRLGVNVGPILAGAGIIGLGVGLGAQSLVKDLINGLFILFQDMISVGDWVEINGKSGMVEAISLRAVRLRDLSANVVVIPNSAIDVYTNMTKTYSRYVFDISVAYREDVDEVMEVMAAVGLDMQSDPEFGRYISAPLEILGLDKFDDSAVVIRARFTTKPMWQWPVGREYNRRLKKRFDELGIEIPFPHRTLYMGEPKKGPAPPVQVRLEPDTAGEGEPDDENP